MRNIEPVLRHVALTIPAALAAGRTVRRAAMAAALAAFAWTAQGADDAVGAALGRRLLPKGNTIVYGNMFKAVCEADMAADEAWSACTTPDALAARQAAVKSALAAALGGLPEPCSPNTVRTGRVERDGYAIEKIYFDSEPGHRVTANLFLPDPAKFPGRRPGIAIPCGHSLNGKASLAYQRAALQSAKAGFAAICYDPIDQGERRQSRNSDTLWNCPAHNNIGRRAELLGWSAARFRIRDGMRAIDILASRPEVDPSRIGVMGHSGGGTMTSWLMALDDRISCAAPSGFLSTIRDVCDQCGPQDAEQFVFGELAFGFNHLGHVLLRAPSPVLLCSSHADFFPFAGVEETARRAAAVYSMLGRPDAFALSDVPGPHHWHESTRTRAVAWMDRWLQDGPLLAPIEEHRKLFYGFDYAKVDTALGYAPSCLADVRTNKWEANATPTGCTLDLPGERTVYDIMRDEAARARSARPPLSPETVRRVAGIRQASGIRAEVRAAARIGADGASSAILLMEDGTPVPAVSVGAGEPALVVGDAKNRAELAPLARKLVAEGCRATVADIRGFGETSTSRHPFYGIEDGDEELAQLGCLLGTPLAGRRAEDIIAAARFAGGGRPVKLVACGRAAIPAAHAWAAERGLFSELSLVDPPDPWEKLFEDDAKECRFADVVHGAWRFYDWTDLVRN